MPTEADARIVVDRLLREAGWNIEDKSQVSTEEAAADGRADYVLKNQRSQPLAPIETKRFSVDPYSAKEQAREYAVMRPEHLANRSREAAERFLDYLPSVSCLQEVFFLRRPILLDPDDEMIWNSLWPRTPATLSRTISQTSAAAAVWHRGPSAQRVSAVD